MFNTIKQLSRSNSVTLCCFSDLPVSDEQIKNMSRFCRDVKVLCKPGLQKVLKLTRYIENLATAVPYAVFSAWDKEKRQFLSNLLNECRYDVIIAEHLLAGAVIKELNPPVAPETLKIIVHHNVESDLYRSILKNTTSPLRIFHRIKHLIFRKYEKRICVFFDLSVVMSAEDLTQFKKMAPKKLFLVLPNGVDTGFYSMRHFPAEENNIYYIGSLKYFPNIDAVHFFMSEIFPLIVKKVPDIRFFIIGGNPPDEIKKYHDGKQVIVTGYQKDTRDIISQCKACVVPLRLGSGTRLKITEAMSLGVPVISTVKGAEGLEIKDGENILIENTPEEFSDCVVSVLTDSYLSFKLSQSARNLMDIKYSWYVLCQKLEYKIRDLHSKKGVFNEIR